MKNLETFYIKQDERIQKVIEKININKKQFLAIINEQHKLVGTITDGDIRRGFLNGVSIDDQASKIMNQNPIKSSNLENREFIVTLMTKGKVKQCPLVDKNDVLKDIYFYDDVDNTEIVNNYIIIMAGGLGTRLMPITRDIPKAMVEVKGKPLLEQMILNLKSEGFTNFFISVNYLSEIIIEYFGNGEKLGIKIDYIKENKRMGTAGALSLIKKIPAEPILVLNCDLVTNLSYKNILNYHLDCNSKATMAIKRFKKNLPYGVIETKKDRIISFVEKPLEQYDINAGIYVFDPIVLSYIPKNTYYDMTEFFNNLIEKDIEPLAFPIYESWNDIASLDDIKIVNKQ
tara:strand:- start:494 stop:1525 length:1032 start_codon:yes stop_codon:yes gene_type:complete